MAEPSMIWYVAHTRPRCEKKLLEECGRNALDASLPCFKSVRRYLDKTVVFEKPIFPGYLFLFISPLRRSYVAQSQYVANLLTVTDQATFQQQLEDVLRALKSDVEIQLAPEIGPGHYVRVKRGPLGGMHGWVESRYGMTTVLLRLDFIGQAAAVKIHADDLESI